MGLRGRVTEPTRLKILRGTARPDRINDREPQPRLSKPSCPKHLDKEAKAEWRRIVPELYELGLLTQLDRAALSAYCSAYSMFVRMESKVHEFGGEVLRSKETGEFYHHPYLSVRNKALDQMRRFLIEFGLTPASRTRIQVGAAQCEDDDPIAEILRRQIPAKEA